MAYTSYRAKVLNGVPTILDNVTLPENAELVVTIISDFPFTVTGEVVKPKIQTDDNKAETSERMAMVESLIGCMAGYDIDLDRAREERLRAKGLLS